MLSLSIISAVAEVVTALIAISEHREPRGTGRGAHRRRPAR
jgi:hypothetical protein